MAGAKELDIRVAGPEDALLIVGVLHDSFVEFEGLYTDGGFAATAIGGEELLARMSEGPVWVALQNGTIVGTVAAVVKGKAVYIRGMAVVPSARELGAGGKLLRQAEDWARIAGYTRLALSTTPFLSSAIELYERFGFRRSEDGVHDLFGTPLFSMEKVLVK